MIINSFNRCNISQLRQYHAAYIIPSVVTYLIGGGLKGVLFVGECSTVGYMHGQNGWFSCRGYSSCQCLFDKCSSDIIACQVRFDEAEYRVYEYNRDTGGKIYNVFTI